MKNRGWILLLVVALVALMLPVAPAELSPTNGTAAAPIGMPAHAVDFVAPTLATHASPTPLAGFPRTVLIETFTGVWCIHCPAETQALHYIDDATSHNVLTIAELHVCYFAPGTGPCLDNYPTSDQTSPERQLFYNVLGVPDVFFDGNHPINGATNSATQMEGEYDTSIANASQYAGNVSIAQNAVLTSHSITDTANITSDLTGSYNVITYLVEYIDKLNLSNGEGPHDVDHVVRVSLMNHPVSLTAGTTTEIHSSTPLNTSWNEQNLSVVTFVQDNSTHVVENANMAPVTTLMTGLSANVSAAISGTTSTISVKVTNSSTGGALANANVTLSVQGGGTLTPSSGTTSASGTFTATYTAPTVTTATEVNITANVTAANYTGGTTTIPLIVNPWILPLVPNALVVSAASSEVPLNWSAPTSGGVGLTYYIYRATAATGPFTQLATTVSESYTDAAIVAGQSYWYKVAARNAGGFSPNTTAISATELAATPQGIPSTVGWWLAFGTTNFTVVGSAAMSLYLPSGTMSYTYGPRSYAYLAPSGAGTLTAKGVSLTLTATFQPRYASLSGTVSPANATVLVNGSPIAVSGGTFGELLVAGTYTVNVTASGYHSDQTVVTLTPGNLTTQNFDLASISNPGGSSGVGPASTSGLSTGQVLLVLIGVVVAAVIVVAAAVMSRGRGGRGPGQHARRRPPPDAGTEP